MNNHDWRMECVRCGSPLGEEIETYETILQLLRELADEVDRKTPEELEKQLKEHGSAENVVTHLVEQQGRQSSDPKRRLAASKIVRLIRSPRRSRTWPVDPLPPSEDPPELPDDSGDILEEGGDAIGEIVDPLPPSEDPPELPDDLGDILEEGGDAIGEIVEFLLGLIG